MLKKTILSIIIITYASTASVTPVFALDNNQPSGTKGNITDGPLYSQSCGTAESNESSSSSTSASGEVPSGDVKAYIDKYGAAAYEMAQKYKLPYVAILAQSALESGWGNSSLTTEGHNFFGIKAGPNWDGEVMNLETKEHQGGAEITIRDDFRKYKNDLEGFEGYGEFIYRNDRYRAAWRLENDPKAYIAALKDAGYATDVNYIAHNHALIDQFEKEIASRNDPKLPPSDKVKFDPSKYADVVKAALAGDALPSESTVGGSDVTDKDSGQVCCTESSTTISGDTPAAKIMSYLVGKDLSAAQAAGIVGNLMHESGGNTEEIDPTADNGTHRGIAQWDKPGRYANLTKVAQKKGMEPDTLEAQIFFLGVELGLEEYNEDGYSSGAYKDTLDKIKAVSGNNEDAAIEAANVFEQEFERSGGSGMEQRRNGAKEVFTKYGSSSSFSGGSSNSGNCSSGGEASKDFVYYSQNDAQWQVDGLDIAYTGCGPTSIAMIIATKKDKNVKPTDVAKHLQSTGDWNNSVIQWTGFAAAGEKWGMTVTEIGTDWEKAKTALKAGKLIIVSGQGSAPYTSGGHIVVARGITDDGKIIIANPAPMSDTPENTPYTIPPSGTTNMWVFE